MTYLLLAMAILSEVFGTLCLKASEGFSKTGFAVVFVLAYLVSFSILAVVLNRGLTLSTSYAIWAGTGIALVAGLSIPLFGDSISRLQLVGIALIIAGVLTVELGGTR